MVHVCVPYAVPKRALLCSYDLPALVLQLPYGRRTMLWAVFRAGGGG